MDLWCLSLNPGLCLSSWLMTEKRCSLFISLELCVINLWEVSPCIVPPPVSFLNPQIWHNSLKGERALESSCRGTTHTTSVAPTDHVAVLCLPFLLLHFTPPHHVQPLKPLLSHLLEGWPCSVLSVLSWKEAQISLLFRKPGRGRRSAAGQRISPPGRRKPAWAGGERSPWTGDIPSLVRSWGLGGWGVGWRYHLSSTWRHFWESGNRNKPPGDRSKGGDGRRIYSTTAVGRLWIL